MNSEVTAMTTLCTTKSNTYTTKDWAKAAESINLTVYNYGLDEEPDLSVPARPEPGEITGYIERHRKFVTAKKRA